MEELLRPLIEKGKQTGSVSFDDLGSALAGLAGPFTPDELATVYDVFERYGIAVIDDTERPEPPVLPAATKTPSERRDPVLLALVRGWGVPATDAISCRDAEGRLFEGTLLVPGSAAVAAWVTVRARLDAFPHWPVIGRHHEGDTFPPGEALHADDQSGFEPDTAHQQAHELIAEAEPLPPEPWRFPNRQRSHPSPPQVAPPVFDPPKPRPDSPSAGDLGWVLGQELMATRDPFRGGPYPFVRVHLAPTPVPWQVFAYWPYGGWNEAPWPAEQLTMVRHWNERFGAELISRPGDYFEMVVWDPPTTRAAALRLADECIGFGEETVFGYGNIPDDERVRRAGSCRVWYFWWD